MRIWIDCTAPAHPIVFRPVIERLRAAGLDWEERDATSRADWKQELFGYSPRGVVPTIVEGDSVTIGHDGGG